MRHADPKVARLELLVGGDIRDARDRREKNSALQADGVNFALGHREEELLNLAFEFFNLAMVLLSHLHEHARHPRNPILGAHPVRRESVLTHPLDQRLGGSAEHDATRNDDRNVAVLAIVNHLAPRIG